MSELHLYYLRGLLIKSDDVFCLCKCIYFFPLQWCVRCVASAATSAPSFQSPSVSAVHPAHVPTHPTPRSPPYWHVCRWVHNKQLRMMVLSAGKLLDVAFFSCTQSYILGWGFSWIPAGVCSFSSLVFTQSLVFHSNASWRKRRSNSHLKVFCLSFVSVV